MLQRDAAAWDTFYEQHAGELYGFVYRLVRREDPLQATVETQGHTVWECGGLRQSPRGVWYPTVVRWKTSAWPENKDKPSGVEFHDETTYFCLDFSADLPDALFIPTAPTNR
jgi:hypothetical protein